MSRPSQPALSTLPDHPVQDVRRDAHLRELAKPRHTPRIEKDADDPTTPRSRVRSTESTTLTTLSRLFAVQGPTSPEASRHSSYISSSVSTSAGNLHTTVVAALPDHLYARGLREGRHSDIIVNAFGQPYRLHRIVLDRAPFFSAALSRPWMAPSANSMTVDPVDVDDNITQASFELALKRLYGCSDSREEGPHAIALFATGCWLEMQDLIHSSVQSILRQMSPDMLGQYVKLVTRQYYGRPGDQILTSAKAMLCRDGWSMSLRNWDDIPGDVIREVIGGDSFFVDGEWDRWILAKRILDRRLKNQAVEGGLVEPGHQRKLQQAPNSAGLLAIRFNGVCLRNTSDRGRDVEGLSQEWVNIYAHPDIEPLLVLLDEGIHYVHLNFEQLQSVRHARDSLGLPVMPERVISSALWQQMELRQKIMNARDTDMELDLSNICTENHVNSGICRGTTMSTTTPSTRPNARVESRVSAESVEEIYEDIDSGSSDGNKHLRKFWIPGSDSNMVIGGLTDPVVSASNNTALRRHMSRFSDAVHPENVQWAADFTSITPQPQPSNARGDGITSEIPLRVSYTYYPPFRFAAEFPNPRLLKEKKRYYSRTVFYAGSFWNIYIRKITSTRSRQLGVYLHRAKERETEEVIAGTAGLAQGSVDERIDQLEREMLTPSSHRDSRPQRHTTAGPDSGLERSESAGDASLAHRNTSNPMAPTRFGDTDTLRGSEPSPSPSHDASSSHTSHPHGHDDDDDDLTTSDSSSDSEGDPLSTPRKLHHTTLPPYVDARPTIKTYFKIYSPSRGGRMLSVYESAPDEFNFSQSLGWKSSTLMLDEGLEDEGGEAVVVVGGEEGIQGSGIGVRSQGDGKLRFMVVIGNI